LVAPLRARREAGRCRCPASSPASCGPAVASLAVWPTLRLVHLPVHASWLNQVEIYLSICQRKVLTPNDFADLGEVEYRLLAFQLRYEQTAVPLPGAVPGPILIGCCVAWRARSGCWRLPEQPSARRRRTALPIPAKVYTITGMGWCSLLLTHEVRAWLAALGHDDFGRVAFYLDLLCQRRGQLEAPYSRCLSGRLRQLELPGRRRVHRLTYWADGDGTVVLLTVWRRWRGSHHELERAATALRRRRSPNSEQERKELR
jgi:hypothetical protein